MTKGNRNVEKVTFAVQTEFKEHFPSLKLFTEVA